MISASPSTFLLEAVSMARGLSKPVKVWRSANAYLIGTDTEVPADLIPVATVTPAGEVLT